MQGQHPKHRGVSDPALLGTVERYFAEIMHIPRLAQRIHCFMFTRTFASTVQQALLLPWLWLLSSVNSVSRHMQILCP